MLSDSFEVNKLITIHNKHYMISPISPYYTEVVQTNLD